MFIATAVALTTALVLPTPAVAAALRDTKIPLSLYEIVQKRSADARTMRTAVAVSENTLYALTPNRDAVWMFDGESWSQIGGPAAEIHAGGGQVYATSPTTGKLSWYDHATATWLEIGGPYEQYAVDDVGIIQGLDSTGIFEWWGGDDWRKIGGPASSIMSGGVGLLIATSITTNEPYIYTGLPFLPWNRIGGPGDDFVITTAGYFYGQNKDGIFAWRGNLDWIRVGGPAEKMYTGGYMVATSPRNGDVYRFFDAELRWKHVGGPGDLFSVANDGTLYGLNSSGIWRKVPGDSGWTRVGGPAATFAV
ncbi:hypothetical protein [Micromonospora sp. LOL_024]|uniref:hypothetical protein n=1 Tax=Micromonospora sp. LOL_024 TaxID=3345412 RepID=UPI003A8479F8